MRGRGRVACVVIVATVVVGLSPTVAFADVQAAVDNDATNQLWDCASRRVPFGDVGEDVLRCLTFRFDAPANVRSAVLYLDIDAPTNSLQDTDSLIVAVDQPFDDCSWAQGGMNGCVAVHGGFVGGERSLVVDLLHITCDPSAATVDDQRQSAVSAAVASGVVQVMLQDDTAVLGGWLDINGASAPSCGGSVEAVPAALIRQSSTSPEDENHGILALVLAVAAAVGVVGIAATATEHRRRVRRARRQVQVTRVPDVGLVELDRSAGPKEERSVAVGVRCWPDDIGRQTLRVGAE
jgi:hypothetical protein